MKELHHFRRILTFVCLIFSLWTVGMPVPLVPIPGAVNEALAQTRATITPTPVDRGRTDCTDKADVCYTGEMNNGITQANMWVGLITYVIVLAGAFLATILVVNCRKSALIVPSVVIFIAASAAYYAQEVAYHAAYKKLNSDVVQVNYNDKNPEAGTPYPAQLQSVRKLIGITENAKNLTMSKIIVLTVLTTVWGAAASTALGEFVTLTTLYATYKSAFTKAVQALNTFKLAAALTKTAMLSMGAGGVTAMTTLMGSLNLIPPDFNKGTALCTAPIAAGTTIGTSAAAMAAATAAVAAGGWTATGTLIPPAVPGKPVPEGDVGSPEYNTNLLATITSGANAATTAQAGVTSALAALNAQTLLTTPCTPASVPFMVAIEKASPALATALADLISSLTALQAAAQALVNTSRFLLACCNAMVAKNQTSPLPHFLDFIIPKAYADDAPWDSWLKAIGIGVGALAGVAVALFLPKWTWIRTKANFMFFHPKSRSIFFFLLTGFSGALAGLAGAAYSEIEKRLEALRKLEAELQRLANLPPIRPSPYKDGDFGMLPEGEGLVSVQPTSDGFNLIVTCNPQKDAHCKCPSGSTSCRKSYNFKKTDSGWSYESSFGGAAKVGNLLNDMEDKLNGGDMESAERIGNALLSQRGAFNNAKRKIFNDLTKLPGGKDQVASIHNGIRDGLRDFARAAKLYQDKNPDALKSLGNLGGFGDISPEAVDQAIQANLASGGSMAGGGGGFGGPEPAPAAGPEAITEDPFAVEGGVPTPEGIGAEEAANLEEELKDLKFENQDINADTGASLWELLSRSYRKMAFKFLLKKKKNLDGSSDGPEEVPAAP